MAVTGSKFSVDAKHLLREAVRRAEDDPEWFFSEVLRFPALPWQLEGAEAVLDVRRKARGEETRTNHDGKSRITVRSCHGPGKTQWLALLLHLWNFTTYGLVAATAPKQDQLVTRLWPRYRLLRRSAAEWYAHGLEVSRTKINCWGDEDWGVIAETASDPENLAGYHDTPQLFVVDEASGSRLDPMFPVIEGALTTPGSVCVEIGNPTRSSGEFWSHHQKANLSSLYYRMHVKPEDAPTLISKEWLRVMRAKYGDKSPIYRVRCLGEFVELEENQLIPYGWLTDARDNEATEDGSLPRLVISVDVAAGGEDFTVVEATKFYQSFTYKLRQDTYSFDAKEASRLTALKAARAFDSRDGRADNGDIIVIDAIGVGNGAFNYLVDWGYPVVGFMGGAASSNSDRWRNQRTQVAWAFHDDLQANRVVYADDFVDDEDAWDEYCDQVTAIHLRPGTERVEDLEPKDAHVKRTGKSPDRFDASAMSYVSSLPDIAGSQGGEAEAVEELSSARADW